MLKLEGLKLTPEEKEAALHRKAARLLRIPEEDVLSVQVLRRSIDAREELHLVYTVAAEVRQEKQVLRRCRDRRVSRYAPERYALPEILSPPEVPPVVVGAGRRPVCGAGAGPMRPAPHPAGAGAGHHRPPEGRGDILAHRRAESGVQRTIRRGGSRGLLRREAEHRH